MASVLAGNSRKFLHTHNCWYLEYLCNYASRKIGQYWRIQSSSTNKFVVFEYGD